MTRINVSIAVAAYARDRIYEVATTCRALGFGHTSTSSDLGVLVGSVEFEDLPSLEALPEVISIELQEERGARDGRRPRTLSFRSGAALRLQRSATPDSPADSTPDS